MLEDRQMEFRRNCVRVRKHAKRDHANYMSPLAEDVCSLCTHSLSMFMCLNAHQHSVCESYLCSTISAQTSGLI